MPTSPKKAYDYVYGLKQTHQDTKLAELATKASNWAKNTGNNVSAVSSTAVAEASGNAYRRYF